MTALVPTRKAREVTLIGKKKGGGEQLVITWLNHVLGGLQRSHPASENVVWGWREPSASINCSTLSPVAGAPYAVRRVGTTPSSDSVSVTWASSNRGAHRHLVGVRARVPGAGWRWDRPSDGPNNQHTAHELVPGREYEVMVRDALTGLTSELTVHRTAPVGAMYTTAYRISEYVGQSHITE